jgi:hypothetical protein
LFPLAYLEVENLKSGLKYTLLDCVESIDYSLPPLRTTHLKIEIAKTGKIASIQDPIANISLEQDEQLIIIDSGDEAEKLLQLNKTVKELDPDIIVTNGGIPIFSRICFRGQSPAECRTSLFLAGMKFHLFPKLSREKPSFHMVVHSIKPPLFASMEESTSTLATHSF